MGCKPRRVCRAKKLTDIASHMGFLSQILSHSFGGWKTRARFISYHRASLEALLVLCLHGWCHLGLAASWSTISHADNLKSLYQYFYGLLNLVGVCDSMVEPSRMRIPSSLSLPVFSNVTRQNLWQKSEGLLIWKPHTLLIPVLWTTSLLATHPSWGIMSVFHLPLAPLASAFIVVEGVTVLVHWVVGQVHETLSCVWTGSKTAVKITTVFPVWSHEGKLPMLTNISKLALWFFPQQFLRYGLQHLSINPIDLYMD